jgi:hypothetical protein
MKFNPYALTASLACAIAWNNALASDLSYTVLDFQALSQTAEASGLQTPVPSQDVAITTDSGEGIGLGGSLAIGDRFYAGGAFQSSVIDVNGVVTNPLGTTVVSDEFDLINTRLVFGYVHELGVNFDVFAEVAFESLEFDFGSFAGENFDTDDSGAGGAVGFRWNPSAKWEVFSAARFTPVGKVLLNTRELDSDTLVNLGIRWYFLEDLGLGVNYESGEIETLTISIRFSFGNLPW